MGVILVFQLKLDGAASWFTQSTARRRFFWRICLLQYHKADQTNGYSQKHQYQKGYAYRQYQQGDERSKNGRRNGVRNQSADGVGTGGRTTGKAQTKGATA